MTDFIKFEPALQCATFGCSNSATVATVEPAPPQLGEFVEFPPTGIIYLMMPVCKSCVEKMRRIYE